jgi:hypothetical protein
MIIAGRNPRYAVTAVLNPAVSAVRDVMPALQRIEALTGFRVTDEADLGGAEAAIEMTNAAFATA